MPLTNIFFLLTSSRKAKYFDFAENPLKGISVTKKDCRKQGNESLNKESHLMSPELVINFMESFLPNCLHILQTALSLCSCRKLSQDFLTVL